MLGDGDMSDDPDRYFLYAIGVGIDLDAQLEAIHVLLERHRSADEELTKQIARLEERARAASGDACELIVDHWVDSLHRSVYQDAAHSLAAVGMIAPLVESVLVHSFAAIRTEFGSVLPVAPPRVATPPEKCWDCHWYVDAHGAWRRGLVEGVLQLMESIGAAPFLPALTRRTLTALFEYRNKNFHYGLEWPVEERAKFVARIESEGWDDWFTRATTDNRPWVIYMSSSFVDHCLAFVGQLLDGLGAFVLATQRRLPPDPTIPTYIQRLDDRKE
jgi:hypothetical protein